ncbi:MAG TPA: TorF family putative porin [Allosphingosinicella sp.]|nr:TorF family putative porin [Allosphingosinicella sp.]
MRKTLIAGISALAFSTLLSTPVQAADIGSGFSVNGGATVVSDYRFRGISQTDKRFAVQGTFTIAHSSGFYATVWGSSIDDYVADGGDQEIDLIGGYKHTFSGTTLDVGVLYYYYPGSAQITPGWNSDFFEPYVSVAHTFGPLTAKVTANYAPKQAALSIGSGKEDNLYLAGDLSAGIPNTPISVSGHIGHSWGPSYLTIGKEYTDWNVGVSYTTGPLTLGVQYVDTDGDFFTPSGRNASKAGVVGSIGVSF